jgi:DNA-binding CsgD family transcriptional regulator
MTTLKTKLYTETDLQRKIQARVKLESVSPGQKRILYLLADNSRLTNKCIAEILNVTHSTVSSDLSKLLTKKLLQKEKIGREVFWEISDLDLLVELKLLLVNPVTSFNNSKLLFEQ